MTTATVTAMEALQETVLRRVRHDKTEAARRVQRRSPCIGR